MHNVSNWPAEYEALGRGAKEPESCFVKEGFKLAAKTGYCRTVSNIQGKEIPNDGSRYRETVRAKTCHCRG